MSISDHVARTRTLANLMLERLGALGTPEEDPAGVAETANALALAALKFGPGADPGYVPTTGDEANNCVYTYEGGEHCFACAEERFGALEHDDKGELILANGGAPAIDLEGNRVHWDNIEDYAHGASDGHDYDERPYVLACGDCGRLLAAQMAEGRVVETDIPLAEVWQEYAGELQEQHQDYRDEHEQYNGVLERLTEMIADIPRGIRTFDELLQEVNEREL